MSSNLAVETAGKWQVESAVQNNGSYDWDFDGMENSDWVLELDCLRDTTLEFTADGQMITENPSQTLSAFGFVFDLECLSGTTLTQDVEFSNNSMTVYALDAQGNRTTNGTTFSNVEMVNGKLFLPDFYGHARIGTTEIVDFTLVKIN